MANIRLIKNKKGPAYQVDIRIKGYRRIVKTFYNPDAKKAKAEAQLWAADIELQMQKGIYKEESPAKNFDDERNKIYLVADLIDYFKKEIAPHRYSYHEKYNTMYEWWKKQIGGVPLKNLQSSMLSSCKHILATEKVQTGKEKFIKRGNNTINKYLMCLSAVLTYAVKELEIIEINPMAKVGTMKKPKGRTRMLSEKEIPLLTNAFKNCSLDVFIFYLILITTGGRYSEVLHLKVEDIDRKNCRVLFLDTKNGTHRGIGITQELLNLILEHIQNRKIETGYIFLNRNKTGLKYMRAILNKVINDVGIKNFHIHDLRHTFASDAAKDGASLLDIAILLGHKSLVMARRYSHLTQTHTDDIARKVANNMNLGL